MLVSSYQSVTLANSISRIISGSLLVLLTLSALTVRVAAQTDQEKSAAADKLITEAKQLSQQGTRESYRKAIEKWEQALVLSKSIGDRRTEARTLTNIGIHYQYMDENTTALEYLEQALAAAHAIGENRVEALALTFIGSIYHKRGEQEKALSYHLRALSLIRAVGDRNVEASILNNIANIQDAIGEKRKALASFKEAQQIARAIGSKDGEAVTFNNIGSLFSDLNEPEKALDSFMQALTLYRSLNDRSGEASVLNNIANVYLGLGEPLKAVEYLKQALSLYIAIEDHWHAAEAMGNIANAFSDLGDKQAALEYHFNALTTHRRLGNRPSEGLTLGNIGRTYGVMGDFQKAIDFNKQALEIERSVGDRHGEAATLTNLGVNYESLGEQQKALDYYTQALTIRRAMEDRGGEAATLQALAMLERNRGNLDEARKHLETAIGIVEELRGRIVSEQLRASYFGTVQSIYEFYVDLLMRLHKQSPKEGYDGKALQAHERARARALLDTLVEGKADIRQGIDGALLERERSIQKRLNAGAKAQLLNGQQTEGQSRTIAIEIATLARELQQVETEIRRKSPRYAALTQPQPLGLKEIQAEVLDGDTLLLEYSLSEERSYLWAVTATSIVSYELPKRNDIESLAREIYSLLTNPAKWDPNALAALRSGQAIDKEAARRNARRKKSAANDDTFGATTSPAAVNRLGEILLGPVASQLGQKRLLIVAEGALEYIPFSILPTPAAARSPRNSETSASPNYRPLVIDHEIISLPSASTLAVLRREMKDRKPAEKSVAVLADPVFESDDERLSLTKPDATAPNDDPSAKSRVLPSAMKRAALDLGLTGGDLRIPRLPGTREEARQILALVPTAEGKQSLDFSASRQTAMSSELSKYRYIHFATHGFLDSLHPELSGIVFSMIDEKGNPQDGFLRAHEVFNLKLPAELVVLSACQTGLGKEVRGEGLVGLTRGFMYAGAPRVVVSLWSVNDQATAELMARFYRGMLRDKLRPAAALRAAQISLMKEKSWESPFYWAAFTLQGEWR